MSLSRRSFLSTLTGGAALAPWLAWHRAMAAETAPGPDRSPASAHQRLAAVPGLTMHGHEQVAMLLYPGFTALDLVGPHYFFASMMGAKVHLVTNQAELTPVVSDLGLAIVPTATLNDCPAELAVLFVPGGTDGTLDAMQDEATRAFLKDRATRARFVTSVCTGSLVLAATGLLRDRRATSHWIARSLLAEFGAIPTEARVVTDGRIMTAAGVSAGLDLAITLVAALRGRPYAEALMLQGEYAPEPPIPGGTPANTAPAITEPFVDMFQPFCTRVRAMAAQLRSPSTP